MFITSRIQKLCGIIHAAEHHVAKPRPNRHIRNGVLIARNKLMLRQLLIQHVEQALGFHGKAVDGVLNFHRRVMVKVTKTTAEERCRAL